MATVLEGRHRYERWEHHRVAEVTELGPGDVVWWRDPLHDVHRQEGPGRGAVELVLVGRYTPRGELPGPEVIRRALEEDMPSTRRLRGWRATMTEDGLVAEMEARVTDTASGEERMWREIHVLHLAGGTIPEHTIYCTGVWDGATMVRHAAEVLVSG